MRAHLEYVALVGLKSRRLDLITIVRILGRLLLLLVIAISALALGLTLLALDGKNRRAVREYWQSSLVLVLCGPCAATWHDNIVEQQQRTGLVLDMFMAPGDSESNGRMSDSLHATIEVIPHVAQTVYLVEDGQVLPTRVSRSVQTTEVNVRAIEEVD